MENFSKYDKEIKKIIQESIDTKEKLKFQTDSIGNAADIISNAYKNGKKVLIFGNGGSAADAQHIAGEFEGRFMIERKALPCLALHTNTSIITALGNDYGFNYIFKRQLEANMNPGDIVIGISTSGNSPNVVEAMEYARSHGGITIALVGENKCKLDDLAEIIIKVPSTSTPRIQESHILIGHIICNLVEKSLFGDGLKNDTK